MISRHAKRGQATVELAIGLTVFVVILVLGIHFAEIGYLTLRVEDAANFALFEATGHRLHKTFTGKWNMEGAAVTSAENLTQSRFKDFDGRASASTGSKLTQVFTRAKNLKVVCKSNQGGAAVDTPNIELAGTPAAVAAAYGRAASENAGISCQVGADLTAFKAPTAFLDGSKGFFKRAPYKKAWEDLHVCAAGRATGTSCKGKFVMALDDWGFRGKDEAKPCELSEGMTGCSNKGYFNMTRAAYESAGAGNGAAEQLAQWVSGTTPTQEAAFYMSFRGEDSPYGPFFEQLPAEEINQTHWDTTPFTSLPQYQSAYNGRGKCFLGKKC